MAKAHLIPLITPINRFPASLMTMLMASGMSPGG